MDDVRDLRKKYCPAALFIAIMAAMIMIFVGHRELARGLILGTLFSIINFVLMGMSIQLRIQKTRRSGTIIALLLVLMRIGFLAVPLVVALSYDKFHVVATIAGLFMVQAVILGDALRKMVASGQG